MSEENVRFHFQAVEPQRLDKYLVENLTEFSRSRIQAYIKDGKVIVNGVPAHKTGQMLETGDQVEVSIPPAPSNTLEPEAIPLQIIFENEHLLVINKPAGMVVHPAAGHYTGTLVHAALSHVPEMVESGQEQRPGVVHRLDKNTSGLIIMAKNDRAHRWLVNRFRDRRVEKVYLALVDGAPPTPTGRIETPIGRSSSDRKKMAVVPESRGREAVSEYRTVESFRNHTLLEVHPITGRTHQIRIHMEFVGCPVTGDTVYGKHQSTIPLKRHFLHAHRLTFHLPGENVTRTFESPLPPELEQVLQILRESG